MVRSSHDSRHGGERLDHWQVSATYCREHSQQSTGQGARKRTNDGQGRGIILPGIFKHFVSVSDALITPKYCSLFEVLEVHLHRQPPSCCIRSLHPLVLVAFGRGQTISFTCTCLSSASSAPDRLKG